VFNISVRHKVVVVRAAAKQKQRTQKWLWLFMNILTRTMNTLVNVNHCGASLSEYIGYQQWISRMSVQFRGVNNLWLAMMTVHIQRKKCVKKWN